MSDTYPISATALLEEADRIIGKEYTNQLYSFIIADLQVLGYDSELIMIAGEIIARLDELDARPEHPAHGLQVFLNIYGRTELEQVVTDRLDVVKKRKANTEPARS
ncbi:hypothetical protein ACG98H_07895 [Corynebacterium sp. L4756]|uniref:hypothetical protein n=1 Tax=unclassified Corynebacterium TaxID=2624378 RepID=UPI00374C8D1D